MLSVQATIGRVDPVTRQPMRGSDWLEFRTEVQSVLEAHTEGMGMWTEVHTGVGEWTDELGTVTEESVKIAVMGVGNYDSKGLMKDLAEIAEEYGQDAIGLTVSAPILVRRRSHVVRKSLLLA